MRIHALVALLLAAAGPALAQGPAAPAATAVARASDAQRMLDSAIVLARTYSLWRDTVHWDVVIPRLQLRLAGARTLEAAYPAIGMLARSLGDRHSHLRVPPPQADRGVKGSESSAPAARGRRWEPPIEPRWLSSQRVGYLRIPAHDGGDVETSRRMAADARAALASHHRLGACGYVVDVRGNTGGNMWPMLASLRPLLGEGTLGAFRDGSVDEPWGARASWDRDDRYVAGAPAWPDLTAMPVAVLTDEATASSGEAVVTAFRGRAATRSFGAPTAGLSTVNNGYPLPGGAMLLLTTAVLADRTGAAYGGPIAPDSIVRGDPDRDAPLEAGLAWLASQPACTLPAGGR